LTPDTLDAALSILVANVDTDDPRVKAEQERQFSARLLRVIGSPLESARAPAAVDPDASTD
jgi:hypothetical protein